MSIKVSEVLPYFISAANGDPRLAWYGLLVAMRETGGGATVGSWKTADGNASRNLGAITGTGDAGFFIHGDSRPGPNGTVIKYETKFRCYSSYALAAADIIRFLREGARRGVSTGSLLAATAGQYRDGYYTGIRGEKWKNVAEYYQGHHRNATKSKPLCPPGGWLELEASGTPPQAAVQAAWNAMMGGNTPIAPQAKPIGPPLPLVPGGLVTPTPIQPTPVPKTATPPGQTKTPGPTSLPPPKGGNRTGPGNPPIRPTLMNAKGYTVRRITNDIVATIDLIGGKWKVRDLALGGRATLALAQRNAEPLGFISPSGTVFRVADAAGSWHTTRSLLDLFRQKQPRGHGVIEEKEAGDVDLSLEAIQNIPASWLLQSSANMTPRKELGPTPEAGDVFVGPSWMYGKGDAYQPPPPPPAPPPLVKEGPAPVVPVQRREPDATPPPMKDAPPPPVIQELDPPEPPPLSDLVPPPPVPIPVAVPPKSDGSGSEEEIVNFIREAAIVVRSPWLSAVASDPGAWVRLSRDLTGVKKGYRAVVGSKTFYGYHAINAAYDSARIGDIGLLKGFKADTNMGGDVNSWPRQGLLALVHLRWCEKYILANYTMVGGSAWDLRPSTPHGTQVAASAHGDTPLGEQILRAFWAGSSPAGVLKAIASAKPLSPFPGPGAG